MNLTKFRCAVVNCINWHTRSSKNLDFYSFPEDKDLCRIWASVSGQDYSLLDLSMFKICSRHFNVDDFEIVLENDCFVKRLKGNAVPHLYIVNIKEECVQEDNLNYKYKTVTNKHACHSPNKNLDNTNFGSVNAVERRPPISSVSTESIANIRTEPVLQNTFSEGDNYTLSSVPANQSWPGLYDFQVSFGPQEKACKGLSWTFSEENNKLYVNKDVPCPVNFSVNRPLPDDVLIRAQVFFTSVEYASEAVPRCRSHHHEDLQKGIRDADHLVRCETQTAKYETDPTTRHNSVLVRFENPGVGQDFSTYIFKFTCFGSCTGGPNRRSLMLIFNLEQNGKVVGRQKLDVKICACPGRDRKAEEKQSEKSCSGVKRKHSDALNILQDTVDFIKDEIPASTKKPKESDGRYTIHVKDKALYDFLVQMKKLYKFNAAFQKLPSSKKKIFYERDTCYDSESTQSKRNLIVNLHT